MQTAGVLISMSITPEQLAKRRLLIKERLAKKQEKIVSSVNGTFVSPEKKWKRRGIPCDRTESMFAKLNRMRRVETSVIVPLAILEKRMGKCVVCPHVSERMDGLLFCECCGCSKWTFKIVDRVAGLFGRDELALGSDLRSKNKHAQHECLAAVPQFGVYEKGKDNGSC